jgi:hypothetical protein
MKMSSECHKSHWKQERPWVAPPLKYNKLQYTTAPYYRASVAFYSLLRRSHKHFQRHGQQLAKALELPCPWVGVLARRTLGAYDLLSAWVARVYSSAAYQTLCPLSERPCSSWPIAQAAPAHATHELLHAGHGVYSWQTCRISEKAC